MIIKTVLKKVFVLKINLMYIVYQENVLKNVDIVNSEMENVLYLINVNILHS